MSIPNHSRLRKRSMKCCIKLKQQHIERIKDESPSVQFLVAVITHFHYKDSVGTSLYDIRSLINGNDFSYQTGHLCLRISHVLNQHWWHKFLMHWDFLPVPAQGPGLSWPATMPVWRMQWLPPHSSAPCWMDHNCTKDHQDLVSCLYFLLSHQVSSE